MAIAHRMVWLLLWAVRCVVRPAILLFNLRRGPRLPHMNSKLLLQSATSLAHLIKTRQLTSEEVVRAYIARVREVNPLLNAVVEERFAAALSEARAVDHLVQTQRGAFTDLPLLGVPVTVKESIAVKGMSHTASCPRFATRVADEDADVVRRMREAGAIPLLVSNTPELCINIETYSKMHGVTNNPYDLRRTPGGSSGGEAALLGAGASVVGIGSDIGGSLRIPAMYTGVFGHKPTPRVISVAGHLPGSVDPSWTRYFVLGPMVRYAEDLKPVVRALAGEKAPLLHLDDVVNIGALKVYYLEDGDGGPMTNSVHPSIKKAVRRAVTLLEEKHQIKASKLELDGLKDAFMQSVGLMLGLDGITSIFDKDSGWQGKTLDEIVGPQSVDWRSVWPEVLKYVACMSDSALTAVFYGAAKRASQYISEDTMSKLAASHAQLKQRLCDILGRDGVLLCPTFVDCAHFHNEMLYNLTNATNTMMFNTLEVPATSCPMGLNSEGMPIGIQVVAAPFQDRLTIAVAQELETAFGGWVPPPAAEE